MRRIARVLLVMLAVMCGMASILPAALATPNTTNIDDFTSRKIDELLAARTSGASKGDLVELLSRQFLGTPYTADMLIGSASQPEQLVIDFRGWIASPISTMWRRSADLPIGISSWRT